MDSSICQVRLDFDTLVLGGNDETDTGHAGCCGANCNTGTNAADGLSIDGKSGKNPPTICHTNTGYHSKISFLGKVEKNIIEFSAAKIGIFQFKIEKGK